MGRGGGEGRVPSLMTAAVEREVLNFHFFSFFFDVSSMGHSDIIFMYAILRLNMRDVNAL
jgi:hypothetical protein